MASPPTPSSWKKEVAPPSQGREAAPILVVDDQPVNVDAIEALLVQSECRIVRAHSADQALLALLEQDCGHRAFDIKMPGMNGRLADSSRHASGRAHPDPGFAAHSSTRGARAMAPVPSTT